MSYLFAEVVRFDVLNAVGGPAVDRSVILLKR